MSCLVAVNVHCCVSAVTLNEDGRLECPHSSDVSPSESQTPISASVGVHLQDTGNGSSDVIRNTSLHKDEDATRISFARKRKSRLDTGSQVPLRYLDLYLVELPYSIAMATKLGAASSGEGCNSSASAPSPSASVF